MSLKDEIVVNLELLNYPLVDSLVVDGDPKDLNVFDYAKIINWLSKELAPIFQLENIVQDITSENDNSTFKIEVNALLKELNSHLTLISLDDENQMLILVASLCGELFSARMLYVNNANEWLVINGDFDL